MHTAGQRAGWSLWPPAALTAALKSKGRPWSKIAQSLLPAPGPGRPPFPPFCRPAAPTNRRIWLPAPMPNVIPTAWISVIMGITTPTAAVWLGPRRAAKKVSDRLYNELTSIPRIAGAAKAEDEPRHGLLGQLFGRGTLHHAPLFANTCA